MVSLQLSPDTASNQLTLPRLSADKAEAPLLQPIARPISRAAVAPMAPLISSRRPPLANSPSVISMMTDNTAQRRLTAKVGTNTASRPNVMQHIGTFCIRRRLAYDKCPSLQYPSDREMQPASNASPVAQIVAV